MVLTKEEKRRKTKILVQRAKEKQEGKVQAPIPKELQTKPRGRGGTRFTEPTAEGERREVSAAEFRQNRLREEAEAGRKGEQFKQRQREQALIGAGLGGEIVEERFAGIAEEKAAQFEEAGVFEEAQFEPLISPEQENLGVILDIFKGLVPLTAEGFKLGDKTIGVSEERIKAKERLTETEIALANSKINNLAQSEIGKEFDSQIESAIVEMGVGAVPLLIGGILIGGFLEPIKQLVGTDKKVKNLTTGIVKLETITTDIASTVVSGDMSTDEAFRRIETIEFILDNMEAELKLAAIESANVRISLKGRDVAIKIFSARSRLNTSRQKIAGFDIEQIINPSSIQHKLSTLENLKRISEEKRPE